MASRTCERCGKVFKYPAHLRMHQKRKTPCALILEAEDIDPALLKEPGHEKRKCRFCGRIFSSYSNMRRHIQTTCQIAPNERNGDEGMEILFEHTLKKQMDGLKEDLAEQKSQNEKMLALIQQLAGQASGAKASGNGAQANANYGTVNNTQQVNVTQNINIFGDESTAHITPDIMRDILLKASEYDTVIGGNQAVMCAALGIFNNRKHPENRTSFMQNKKSSEAMVHMAEGWVILPVPAVLPPMLRKTLDAMFDNQPIENVTEEEVARCGAILKPLQEAEKDAERMRQLAGPNGQLKAILTGNKKLLQNDLGRLPEIGEQMRVDTTQGSDEAEEKPVDTSQQGSDEAE